MHDFLPFTIFELLLLLPTIHALFTNPNFSIDWSNCHHLSKTPPPTLTTTSHPSWTHTITSTNPNPLTITSPPPWKPTTTMAPHLHEPILPPRPLPPQWMHMTTFPLFSASSFLLKKYPRSCSNNHNHDLSATTIEPPLHWLRPSQFFSSFVLPSLYLTLLALISSILCDSNLYCRNFVWLDLFFMLVMSN